MVMSNKVDKKEEKLYYIAIDKKTRNAIITRCGTMVSDFLGISTMTVYRRLKNVSFTSNKNYIIIKNIKISKCNKGYNKKEVL